MHVLVQREHTGTFGDADALTARRYEVPDRMTVIEILHFVRDAHMLPAVEGGRATWVAEGERPLAVVTQEYLQPWMLARREATLVEMAGRLPKPHLLFRYFARRSPEDVFRQFGGDPVRLSQDDWKPSREITWTVALRDFFAQGERFRR